MSVVKINRLHTIYFKLIQREQNQITLSVDVIYGMLSSLIKIYLNYIWAENKQHKLIIAQIINISVDIIH